MFITASLGMLALPLGALIGTRALWFVLGFAALAIWAVWAALQRSTRESALIEELVIWPDRVTLRQTRQGRSTPPWQANPHWLRIIRHDSHPLADYLTLRGGPREVELGAFLTPQERRQLYDDVNKQLGMLRER